MYIVEAHELSRRFKSGLAVEGLNLTVQSGGVFALIGPNGAGKTTTVRMLTTLLAPTGGSAQVNGFDVLRQPHQVRASIGYIPQDAQADEALTGREHLILQGRLYRMDSALMARRIDEVLELVGLRGDADKRALQYSGGMRKLLDIATGLLHRPRILFLDEPTAGVDVTYRERLLGYIRDLPASGTTLFLTSHFLDEVDRLANYIVLMNHGRIVVEGSPTALKAAVGNAVVDVVLDSSASTVDGLIDRLLHAPNVGKVSAHGSRIKLFTNAGDDMIVQIRREVDAVGLELASISIARPTLNDVFFYHRAESDQ